MVVMLSVLEALEAEMPKVFDPGVVLVSLVGEQQKVDVILILYHDVEWILAIVQHIHVHRDVGVLVLKLVGVRGF